MTSPAASAAADGTVPTTAAGGPAADGGAEGGWPCSRCSAVVPLSEPTCPACGSAFLAPLAGDGGRHRSSQGSATRRAGRLPRPARLIAGAFVGLLLAVVVPLVLALLG
jgi:hypothetical protein